MRRMAKIKDVPSKTNGLISRYMARRLFLAGKIPGCRLGSTIIIDLDGLEKWLEDEAGRNIEQASDGYGKIRRIM